MRLNKYLAQAGLGSRRSVEQYILEGRVTCDGQTIDNLGFYVPENAKVTLDGKPVDLKKYVYFVLNKPRGYISAVKDGSYPVVLDLFPPEIRELGIFPVGRLDLQSEGLLILSNDGDFAQELIHPSSAITREYEVRLDKVLHKEELDNLKKGVMHEGRLLKPIEVRELWRRTPNGRWAAFVLGQGIKREIRMMAEEAGMKVEVLFRRKIGKMELKRLKSGHYCQLSLKEIWDAIEKGAVL